MHEIGGRPHPPAENSIATPESMHHAQPAPAPKPEKHSPALEPFSANQFEPLQHSPAEFVHNLHPLSLTKIGGCIGRAG